MLGGELNEVCVGQSVHKYTLNYTEILWVYLWETVLSCSSPLNIKLFKPLCSDIFSLELHIEIFRQCDDTFSIIICINHRSAVTCYTSNLTKKQPCFQENTIMSHLKNIILINKHFFSPWQRKMCFQSTSIAFFFLLSDYQFLFSQPCIMLIHNGF